MTDLIAASLSSGRLLLIAGPCVIESKDLCFEIAETVKSLAEARGLTFVFKSSYTKANRLSGQSFSGPGIDPGLEILQAVKQEFSLPVLTDVHETIEVPTAAEVVDILQIPAFLCRQTALVRAAGATGKWVNIKKGQFLHPADMGPIAAKAGTTNVMLTERGSSFGYRQLVIDFRSLIVMKELGYPVVFDATHSLQQPGGGGTVTTGQPEFVIPMARAAAAVGIDGLFVETHPRPAEALSDAGVMLPLEQMERLLDKVLAVRKAGQNA